MVDKADIILQFFTGQDENNNPIYKKVTLAKANPNLTDAQFAQVISAIGNLSRYPIHTAYAARYTELS